MSQPAILPSTIDAERQIAKVWSGSWAMDLQTVGRCCGAWLSCGWGLGYRLGSLITRLRRLAVAVRVSALPREANPLFLRDDRNYPPGGAGRSVFLYRADQTRHAHFIRGHAFNPTVELREAATLGFIRIAGFDGLNSGHAVE